ncbi:Strictosidine synthase conserved region [Trinorchestia longiramus]|nr:Strictosidine synthase conserved region [Trinorchestia longiramus]
MKYYMKKAFWEEKVCGRPLGLRFAHDGKLLVADAYFGIYKVDVDTGLKEQLVDAQIPINGKRPMLIDDLDEDSEGNIFFSDASTIAHLSEGTLELLAGPTGRLIRRDASTGHSSVLLDKILFANGVQLSPQEDFVLVSETVKSRVIRYWLKGEKAGSSDTFVDKLPGYPDNIRPRPEGGYYVTLVSVKTPDAVDMIATSLRLPWLRRLLARIGYGTIKVLEFLGNQFQNDIFVKASYKVMNLATSANLMSKEGSMVVALNAEGLVQYSLQSPEGVVGQISETTQTNDKLIFGSPFNKFVAMISLDKLKPGSADEPHVKRTEIDTETLMVKEEL